MLTDIRRRANGTIDIEHYRRHAIDLRREASIDLMSGLRPTLGAVAVVLLLLGVLVVGGRHHMGTVQQAAATAAPGIEAR